MHENSRWKNIIDIGDSSFEIVYEFRVFGFYMFLCQHNTIVIANEYLYPKRHIFI